jgi:high-affinity nickel-transport protein
MLPRALREGSSAFVAIPIGLLFGFGFETSSQLAAYAVAFGADAGIAGALAVGAMFSAGMICTDTLDSVLVHRLISYRSHHLPALMRVWIASVTALAVAVALYETAQVLGWRSPFVRTRRHGADTADAPASDVALAPADAP